MFFQCYIHNKLLSNTQSHLDSSIFRMTDTMKESIIKSIISLLHYQPTAFQNKEKCKVTFSWYVSLYGKQLRQTRIFKCLLIMESSGKEDEMCSCHRLCMAMFV